MRALHLSDVNAAKLQVDVPWETVQFSQARLTAMPGGVGAMARYSKLVASMIFPAQCKWLAGRTNPRCQPTLKNLSAATPD
jgi:hypothetical protein